MKRLSFMCAHAPETRSFISGSHLALNLLDGFLKFDNDFLLIFKIFLGFQRILGRSWSRPRRAHERHGALQTQAWRVLRLGEFVAHLRAPM